MRLPDFRTLPSRMVFGLSARPISLMFTCLLLKAKADVRAATLRPSIFAKAFSSSSARPSQKYSFSGSALMFLNGSTAIDGVFVRRVAASGRICGPLPRPVSRGEVRSSSASNSSRLFRVLKSEMSCSVDW